MADRLPQVKLFKWYTHTADENTVYYAFFFSHRLDNTNSFVFSHKRDRWNYDGISNMNSEPNIWYPIKGDRIPSSMLKLIIEEVFNDRGLLR